MFTNALAGKVVVVTGASSGLGAHFSQVAGRQGATVVLLARREHEIKALSAHLATQNITACPCVADVTDRASLEPALNRIASTTGRFDVLINNAGIAATNRFLDMTEDEWQQVIDVDLTGVWRTGQIVARIMAQQPATEHGCSIVNISSVLAKAVQPTQSNYASAKAGVEHLTRVMARELVRYNIRVNAIAPGYFQTQINADYFASDAGQRYVETLFPRRTGRLEELDGALLLLASNAGSYINGTTLVVDGGTMLGAL